MHCVLSTVMKNPERLLQRTFLGYSVCTKHHTFEVSKRVRSTSLYHSRQCGIVFKPCSDHGTVVCFVTQMHDYSPKLRKQR